jgi:hypothetical protein
LLDEEDIYNMAGRIAVVEDAYYQMTEYEYLGEDEAEYLLGFYNPLEMIADTLEMARGDEPVEIDGALFELFEREDDEERYITVEFAEELKRKYGGGTNIELALLSEAVDAGNEFLRLQKLIDHTDEEGAGFCFCEE